MVAVVILIFCFCGGTNRGHRMISMLGRKGVPELDWVERRWGHSLVVLMQSVKQNKATPGPGGKGTVAHPQAHAPRMRFPEAKKNALEKKEGGGGGRCMALRR